jgi:hypothetical protein
MTTDPALMNQRLIALSENPEARFWRLAYSALTPAEQVFRAVWEVESEINNGGFNQYFFNSSGALVPYGASALRAIGADAMASILERAIEAVGPGIDWEDDDKRRAHICDLTGDVVEALEGLDQEFYAYPDNLTGLLYEYTRKHADEIGVRIDS